MFDARIPCHKPTYQEAVVIQIRLLRREFQSRIAADYDCSQGRISEIKNHKLHPGSYAEALRQTKH